MRHFVLAPFRHLHLMFLCTFWFKYALVVLVSDLSYVECLSFADPCLIKFEQFIAIPANILSLFFFFINLHWFLINSYAVNTGPSLGHILCFFLFLLFVNFVLLNWTFESCNVVAFGISGYFSKILLFGDEGWLKPFLCYLLTLVKVFLSAPDCTQACECHTGTQQLS